MSPARRLPSWRTDQRGTVATEFAVTFMVLLMVVLGMFEFDLVFLAQRGIDRGVTAAARWIAVNSGNATPAAVQAVFASATAPALGSAQASACTVSISPPSASSSGCIVNLVFSAGAVVGSTVTVTAQYTWTPLTTLVNISKMTLISSAALTIHD